MDASAVKLLVQLGTYGPLGIFAAFMAILFFLERKRVKELTDKVIELSQAHIKITADHEKAYEALERAFDKAIDVVVEKNHG
jgi:hypothetical protein